MATAKKTKIETTTTSRIAARPQAERRVDVTRETTQITQPSYQDVSRRAFEIWEATGRTHGHDVENWLQAEAELGGSAHP